jgi:lipooligosaccharide transport system permease protein
LKAPIPADETPISADEIAMTRNLYALPQLSWRWVAVWRRNYLVWKKLAAESVLGNIVEPLFYLVGFGMGIGTMLPEVQGVKYIAFLAGGTICYSTMLSASFEALYSGFARMHVQRTWEGILNAPISLEDVVIAEWIWAASKSFLSGIAVLAVAVALGLSQSWTMVFIAPLAFLIGLCFAGMGLTMTAMAKSYDFFMYWFTLVLTPQMLLCGVFYPLQNMPGWLQAIANALPLTHAIAIGRPLLLGQWPEAPLFHIAVLLAYGIGGIYIALVLFRRRLLG